MSYRPRPTFDQPTAESVQRTRRASIWIIPAVILQQATLIFGRHGDQFSQLLGAICWTALTIAELWWLLGLPFRWLSERDQAILADRAQREHEVVLLDRRVGVLEVEPVGDLALRLIDGVANFLAVHFGDDIEGGHGPRLFTEWSRSRAL